MRKLLLLLVLIAVCLCACGEYDDGDYVKKEDSSKDPSNEVTFTPTPTPILLDMVDVRGMELAEAIHLLTDKGFTDITYEPTKASFSEHWEVYNQNHEAGERITADSEIKLSVQKINKLYIIVRSEENLFLDKYSVAVYLDEMKIGTIANGKELTYLTDVVEGEHVLTFCKADDTSKNVKKSIAIIDNITFSCVVAHGSKVSVEKVQIEDNINRAAMVVPNVKGMILKEARDYLKKNGFSNVEAQGTAAIKNEANWLVTEQTPSENTTVESKTTIKLTCISLDNYYGGLFKGTSLKEAQDIAFANGVFLVYVYSPNGKDISREISALELSEREDWIVVAAKRTDEKNTAALELQFIGENNPLEPTPTPTPDATATPTPTPTAPPVTLPNVITVDNCPEFKRLMTSAQSGKEATLFWEKIGPCTIEVDCVIFLARGEGHTVSMAMTGYDSYMQPVGAVFVCVEVDAFSIKKHNIPGGALEPYIPYRMKANLVEIEPSSGQIRVDKMEFWPITQAETPSRGDIPSATTIPTKTPTPVPTKAPTLTPAANDNTTMVWIPVNGGTKYHKHSTCSKMDNPAHVTLDEAKRKGFTACKKCY